MNDTIGKLPKIKSQEHALKEILYIAISRLIISAPQDPKLFIPYMSSRGNIINKNKYMHRNDEKIILLKTNVGIFY